jgi:hypothetical protein
MRISLTKRWRWWTLAAASALVIERLRRRRSAITGAVPTGGTAAPVDADASSALTEKELSEIFVLGRHFVETRAAETESAREACLQRAAEIVLRGRRPPGALATGMHREAFLRACKIPMRREPVCEQCGAPMRQTGVFDAGVGELLPGWTCARCGAQTPR